VAVRAGYLVARLFSIWVAVIRRRRLRSAGSARLTGDRFIRRGGLHMQVRSARPFTSRSASNDHPAHRWGKQRYLPGIRGCGMRQPDQVQLQRAARAIGLSLPRRRPGCAGVFEGRRRKLEDSLCLSPGDKKVGQRKWSHCHLLSPFSVRHQAGTLAWKELAGWSPAGRYERVGGHAPGQRQDGMATIRVEIKTVSRRPGSWLDKERRSLCALGGAGINFRLHSRLCLQSRRRGHSCWR
jgi:hypothetical protein